MPVKYESYIKEYNQIVRILTDEILLSSSDKEYKAKCVWDIGSTKCCISMRAVNKLNLYPINFGKLTGTKGTKKSNVYKLYVNISPNLTFEVTAMSFEPIKQDIDFLIGMDIISTGNLHIVNENNLTTLRFDHILEV